MFEIKLYDSSYEQAWNDFVMRSKNGTFLFNRQYMDYHSDRFADHSLLFFRKNALYALLPANRKGNTLLSHQGLTYGGLIMNGKATAEAILSLFAELNTWLHSQGITQVVYKPTPWIYHQIPAQEDLYALTEVCNAQLTAREISSTIMLDHPVKFTESRKSGIRKAIRANLTCKESDDLKAFWQMLDANLASRHQAHPVHSLAELELLHSRFPQNIRLFLVYNKEERPIGGTLVYEAGQVIHTQYIASTDEGKALGALDLLFDELIHHHYSNNAYFDFGKSTEQSGHYLNKQLIFQKEGFGGRGVCYDTYQWNIP